MMAEFFCTMCGKCCRSMGRYVKILGSVSPAQVICRHDLGNEQTLVTINREYREDFDPDEAMSMSKDRCPFLRSSEGGEKYICIIYETRPHFCREFKCARMRIFDRDGHERGAVKGRRSLHSDDEELLSLFMSVISSVTEEKDTLWIGHVKQILENYGYRVEIYD